MFSRFKKPESDAARTAATAAVPSPAPASEPLVSRTRSPTL